MIRYHFSGHLTPRPAGTERAMCALSGEVYLATDVDTEIERLKLQQAREVERLLARCAAADSKVIDLKAKVLELKKANAQTVGCVGP